LGSSLNKLSIFDVVRPFPRRPIKPAGSKNGTVANPRHSRKPVSSILYMFSGCALSFLTSFPSYSDKY
jgi:hypothetical protein